MRNIHLGAKLEGVYRQDVYEIPPESIRELIINAVIHRSYLDRNNIQIAIYDNHLEVTSPGKLAMGQTMDRMKEGYSKIRNEALANAFSYMNLIEHWGSGIPRIINTVLEAGLREPEFIGGDIDLRINIYRGQISNFDPNDPKYGPNEFDNIENLVLSILKDNPSISRREISIQLNVSDSTIKRTLSRLKKTNLIKREGSTQNGKWIINK